MKKIRNALNSLKEKIVEDEVDVLKNSFNDSSKNNSISVKGSFRLADAVFYSLLWFEYEIEELDILSDTCVASEHMYKNKNEFLKDCLEIINNKERLKEMAHDEIVSSIKHKKKSETENLLIEQVKEAIDEKGSVEFSILLEDE